MSKRFVILFICLSFITQTIGSSGVGERVAFSDIFGIMAIIAFIAERQKRAAGDRIVPRMFLLGLLVVVGGAFGVNVVRTFFETVILLFLAIIYYIIVHNFYSYKGWNQIIKLISYTLIACVLVGFYDLYGHSLGLPRIFPARTAGEMKSGFRNAGQAGAYGLMFLVILLPVRLSKAFDLFKPKEQRYINWAIWLGAIFLFLTGKIAAYVGFAGGYLFYLILKRNFTPILVIGAIAGILIAAFPLLERFSPELYQRINYKINARIVKNYERYTSDDGLGEDSFFSNNWGNALTSFTNNPLTGSGLGAFAESFGRYEVHSTYFKVIGEMGLLGTIGYVAVMAAVLALFRVQKIRGPNEYRDYLLNAYPFFLGCMVSWIYTYHLRKREFWIMIAVYVIAYALAMKKWKAYRLKKLMAHERAISEDALSA